MSQAIATRGLAKKAQAKRLGFFRLTASPRNDLRTCPQSRRRLQRQNRDTRCRHRRPRIGAILPKVSRAQRVSRRKESAETTLTGGKVRFWKCLSKCIQVIGWSAGRNSFHNSMPARTPGPPCDTRKDRGQGPYLANLQSCTHVRFHFSPLRHNSPRHPISPPSAAVLMRLAGIGTLRLDLPAR